MMLQLQFNDRVALSSCNRHDINEAAGVSFGSFYNFFSSKKEIARALFIDETLRMLQALDSIPSK
ncbi:TetR family transcriptional regulator [Pseudomonas helleri]|uniref:TetR family transcriptional regulator n=2 Tax=Pseudomonas helleri TaxID=1608996 RepID=A0A6L5I360_9PSED|nr:TetR family transcriptional regulator [Pseudomonas helleri]